MTNRRKLYWDSNCFIAYISSAHPSEAQRALICVDVLENAQRNTVEVWTSVFSIAEVIRRKLPPSKTKPLPRWTKTIQEKAPETLPRLQELWDFHTRKTAGTKALKPEEVTQLQDMFSWIFLGKIQLDERIARKAVSLSQKYGLKAPDAIHAASALERGCDCIQTFDTDYSSISHLISIEEPSQISAQSSFPGMGTP